MAEVKVRVWVAGISHRHGTTYCVAGDEESLMEAVFDYVKDWWNDEIDNEKMPVDPAEAIDKYFDIMGDTYPGEYLDIAGPLSFTTDLPESIG